MLDPSADLITGLVAKWAGAATLSGIAGPYYGGTPEGEELPRCVLTCLPATLKTITGSSRLYDCTAQFRVWDSQPEGASANATLVAAVFGPEALTLPGMTNTRKNTHKLVRSSIEKQDVSATCMIVEFAFVLQQSRS